jgi:glucose-6-phosphate isomerase
MKSEAALLKESPLLINKIVAERMSDKLQIMMVPSDAKIFFNDVLKSGVTPEAVTNAKAAQAAVEESEGSDQEEQEHPAPAQQITSSHKTWRGR